MVLRTDYQAHDGEYRLRRAAGWTGWDRGESLQQTLTLMERFLASCGAGDLLFPLAARGCKLFGVDISPFAIEWAREKACERNIVADFFVGDVAKELIVPIELVDAVIDGHCLHCIIGDDRCMFFRNARKYLKRGGLLHIYTMCGDPHHAASLPQFDPTHRCVVIYGIATRYFGRSEDILQEIERAGFSVEKHEVVPAQDQDDEDCLLVNARVR